VGFTRARIVLLAVVAALVGASVAFAANGAPDPEISLSKTQAASGEEVGFKIANTEAYSKYTLKVENEVVARGSDPAGNGVDDKFKMPDLGSSEKTVTVEATVEQPSDPPDTHFVGTVTMQYVLFPTAPTGPTSDPQPEPVPLVATPQSAPAEAAIPSPPASDPTTGTTHHKSTAKKHSTTNKKESTSGSGGTSTPTPTTTTPAATPIAPSAGSNTAAAIRRAQVRTPTSPTTSKPSGPVGTAGIQPPTGGPPTGSTPLTTPITGTATVSSSSGFPTAALVALALLALAALAVGATRLRFVDWHRFRFALAGPHDPDELRLGALARAARSGAESQQAIAVRKASRRAS
jgi:hypothetical protein